MEVGSVYKLDHSKLLEYILDQIGHVRAVMVEEKTKNKVSISYPSKPSLEMFFGRGSTWLMQPNLDFVYSMTMNLAETVLCNRIPFEEFAARRGTRSFWVNDCLCEEVNSVGGGIGVVKWGLRKRATFVNCEEEQEKPVEIGMIIKKDNEFDDPTPETKLRYKKAEKSIPRVLKAKAAYHGNSIFRADLRTEARKLIGDTGLLDHLLKHMAGKTAPGGKERFRRLRNPAGAMEYWLESADLVRIRMEAGVEDPYWIPPEGWKLGDSPTQDPVCARELKKLREDVDNMKSEIQILSDEKFRLLGGGVETLAITEALRELATDQVVPIAEQFGMDPGAILDNIIYARAYNSEHQYIFLLGFATNMPEEASRPVIALFQVDFSGRSQAQTLSHLLKKLAGGHVLAQAATIRLLIFIAFFSTVLADDKADPDGRLILPLIESDFQREVTGFFSRHGW